MMDLLQHNRLGPMVFYKTKSFQKLDEEWREKLAKNGFKDAEDRHGNLKDMDRVTISFDNRELIADFFTNLGNLLATDIVLSKIERKVLSLYCEGTHQVKIAAKVKKSKFAVHRIIKKYKLKLI